jgi:hypothetical protein
MEDAPDYWKRRLPIVISDQRQHSVDLVNRELGTFTGA